MIRKDLALKCIKKQARDLTDINSYCGVIQSADNDTRKPIAPIARDSSACMKAPGEEI